MHKVPIEILKSHQEGDFEEVEIFYLKKIASFPDVDTWFSLLGVLYAQTHRYEEAYKYFKQAVNINASAANLSKLAAICSKLSLFDEAKSYFDKSLSLESFAPGVYNNYGIMWMKAGDYKIAESYFIMSLTQDGSRSDSHYNLGLCLFKLGKNTWAKKRFEQAISLDNHLLSHYQLALILELDCFYSDALLHYNIVLEKSEHALSMHGSGRCYLKLGEFNLALDLFKKSIQYGENSFEIWYNLAMNYHHLASPALALEAWLKCLSFNSDEIEVLYHIGVCYQQTLRYHDAKIYYDAVLNLNNKHLDSYLNLIAIAIEEYKVELALSLLNKARSFYPDREDLAYLYASLSSDISNMPSRAPAKYVADLFDHYAHHYEVHLINILQYSLPEKIKQLLANYFEINKGLQILDLGCASGLIGQYLRPYADKLYGVDLSEEMLKLAKDKNCYDHLFCTDVLEYIEKENSFDLILMTELLPYFGDLAWLAKLDNILKKESFLIFSFEKSDEGSYYLHEHARYRHSKDYVLNLLPSSWSVIESIDLVLRKNQGKEVFGVLLFVKKVFDFK